MSVLAYIAHAHVHVVSELLCYPLEHILHLDINKSFKCNVNCVPRFMVTECVSMSGVYDVAVFKGRMYFSVRQPSFLTK